MKESTINMRLDQLAVVFKFHQIPDNKNPLKGMKRLADEDCDGRERIVSDDERTGIIQEIKDPELEDYYNYLRYTAFRADITGVKTEWKEVRFRDEKIFIPKHKNKGKKGKKRNYDIDIDGRIFPALLRRYEMCQGLTIQKARELYPFLIEHSDKEIAPVLSEARRYVFPDYILRKRLGHEKLYGYASRKFRDASRKLKIENVTLHDLRRTAGSEFYISSGKDIIATRDFLGHTDVKTTQRYLHIKSLEHTSDKRGTQPVENNPFKTGGTGKAPEDEDLNLIAA